MYFNRAAPFRFPIFIQIDDQVETPVQLLLLVIVKVHVRVQFLAVPIVMRSAAVHFRIDHEIRNTGNAAHQIQKRRGGNGLIQLLVGCADFADLGVHGLVAGVAKFVPGELRIEARKVGQKPFGEARFEKILDSQVLKRLGGKERVAVAFRVPQDLLRDLGERLRPGSWAGWGCHSPGFRIPDGADSLLTVYDISSTLAVEMTRTVQAPFAFRLDQQSGVPVYRQIIDQVQAGIASAALSSGNQLPTVRQVAVDLAINPNTVLRAYRELEIRGVLETQQGTGTFIAERKVKKDDNERTRALNQLVSEFVARAGAGGFTVRELAERLSGFDDRR